MNSGKILFFAGCLTLFVGCSVATEPIDYEDFLKADGEGEFGIWVHSGLYNRLYTVQTPPGMSESGSYPLLILLHGAGGTGESMERSIRPHQVTDSAGFITVYPDGMEGTWTMGCQDCTFAERLNADDVPFLETLTTHLVDYLPIDPTRVYILGHSQGGSLAYLYACTASLPVAGIAVTGSLALRDVIKECQLAEPLSLVVVHGTDDPMAFYSGFGDEAPFTPVVGTVNFFVEEMNCQPQPIQTELPDSAGDFTSVTSFRFPGCDSGGGVLHYRVNGGGHSWPGDTGPWGVGMGQHSRNLDTTREMLRFFDLIENGG
jgi:polyhydroxybutyrate depolymerase